jgi:hypothetical protein
MNMHSEYIPRCLQRGASIFFSASKFALSHPFINTIETLAKLFVIPECLYPRYRHSETDMVFQVVPKADSPRRTVRTRFPLRIAAGMTEWRILQGAPLKNYLFPLRPAERGLSDY